MNIHATVTMDGDYSYYDQALALHAQGVELNRRSVDAYERLAERAAASNERVAAALEELLRLVRKAWDEDHSDG